SGSDALTTKRTSNAGRLASKRTVSSKSRRLVMTLLLIALLTQAAVSPELRPVTPQGTPARLVPAGTVIPVNLTSRISTKHAKEGDGIYAQTAVPIVVKKTIPLPARRFFPREILPAKH